MAALVLLSMGAFLVVDSALKLLSGEHPPIGMVELFDWQVWLGWLMIAALVYSAIPAVVLGRIKMRLAAQLHDKVLYADAKMNHADWMTASAAMVGVVGIGFGLWWADAVAAIVIGLDILHDGFKYTHAAAKDVLDGRPRRHDEEGVHPLVGEVRDTVAGLDWVEEAAVRMRELGHVFSVECSPCRATRPTCSTASRMRSSASARSTGRSRTSSWRSCARSRALPRRCWCGEPR